MQVILVVIAIVLIVAGIYFAINGFGDSQAGGATGVARLDGPAWLILIGLGVGLLIFATTNDFEPSDADDAVDEPVSEPSDADDAVDEPESEPSDGDDAVDEPDSGCRATIRNPFASIRETADPFGQEIMRIPAGTYEVLEVSTVSFANTNQRWLKLAVADGEGWIEHNTILVDSVSDCSF